MLVIEPGGPCEAAVTKGVHDGGGSNMLYGRS